MRDFYLLNVASIDSRRILYKHFGELKKDQLYQIAEFLHMVPGIEDGEEKRRQCLHTIRREVLLDLLVSENERRPSQLTALNEAALFPTEQVVWDENVIPYEHYNGGSVLALNKLNLQFLTLHDYLLRNFNLFQMESTCSFVVGNFFCSLLPSICCVILFTSCFLFRRNSWRPRRRRLSHETVASRIRR
jgi:intron-binding protein aquarius